MLSTLALAWLALALLVDGGDLYGYDIQRGSSRFPGEESRRQKRH